MVLRIITLIPLIFVTGLVQANGFSGIAVNDMLGARLVTQCEIPGGFNSYTQQASLENGSNTLVPYSHRDEFLRLMKTSRGFRLYRGDDPLINEKYLSNSGADEFSIHLIVDRGKGPEHLVFLIDLEGKGEMVWSNDTNTTFSNCST